MRHAGCKLMRIPAGPRDPAYAVSDERWIGSDNERAVLPFLDELGDCIHCGGDDGSTSCESLGDGNTECLVVARGRHEHRPSSKDSRNLSSVERTGETDGAGCGHGGHLEMRTIDTISNDDEFDIESTSA